MGSEMDYTYEERQRDINAGLYTRFFIENEAGEVLFTLADEVAHVIEATLQLADLGGVALEEVFAVELFMADSAEGALAAAAPSGGIAVTTGAQLAEITAEIHLSVGTDGTGLMVIEVTQATAKDFWIAVKLPSGRLAVSPVLAFAG